MVGSAQWIFSTLRIWTWRSYYGNLERGMTDNDFDEIALLTAENEELTQELAKMSREYLAMYDNLTSVQKRCTEQLEEIRRLKLKVLTLTLELQNKNDH
jgi:predicted nuclease with TOPRIM domain